MVRGAESLETWISGVGPVLVTRGLPRPQAGSVEDVPLARSTRKNVEYEHTAIVPVEKRGITGAAG